MFFFEELSRKHRCSQHEKDATDYIAAFADARGLEYHCDDLDNIIVKKPGTKGYEDAPTVILHGHIDMVCKLEDGVTHDFATDGVKLKVDGDRIRAEGTTLGADNGLGISYMLALLDSDDIPHPPLECVMTVMEEMGKVGGDNVDLTKLSGKRMIDFNWIEEKQLLAGCSGDVTCRIDVDCQWKEASAGRTALLFDIRALKGGHCEFDIHFERGNAIALIARLLRRALQTGEMELARISGGVQNNVIPAEAEALVLVPADAADAIETAVTALAKDIKHEFCHADPNMKITVILATMQLGSGSTDIGFGQLFIVIPAAVIGGTALGGGEGGMVRSTLGLLLLIILNNGLVLAGVDPDFQSGVFGLILMAAVITVYWPERGRLKVAK